MNCLKSSPPAKIFVNLLTYFLPNLDRVLLQFIAVFGPIFEPNFSAIRGNLQRPFPPSLFSTFLDFSRAQISRHFSPAGVCMPPPGSQQAGELSCETVDYVFIANGALQDRPISRWSSNGPRKTVNRFQILHAPAGSRNFAPRTDQPY